MVICSCLAALPAGSKEWKLSGGSSVHGDYLRSDAETVTVRSLPEGKPVILNRSGLTPETLQFLVLLEQYRGELGISSWPGRTTFREEIRLTGGPDTFHTAHFQVMRGSADRVMVFRLATVMEDCLASLSRMPTGLKLAPPATATYFRARFMDRAQFDKEFQKVGMQIQLQPGVSVKGAYIASARELWLPVDLRSETPESLAPTVVHEVCHQTMHEWLPLLPEWFNEGFAEYMSSIPYQFRAFHFDRSREGLNATLRQRYLVNPGAINVIHPERLLNPGHSWSNSPSDYLAALLTVYFMIHLDGAGNGESLKRYIGEVARFRDQAATLLSDLRTLADNYQSRVETYRREMDEYQRKMAAARGEMLSGKRVFIHSQEPGRLIIAGTPKIPTLPNKPEELAFSAAGSQREQSYQFISVIQQRALLALLGGRTMEEFAAQMKAAYLVNGVVIHYL